MRDKNLIHQYRLLDRDVALFDSWLNGGGESETDLFIPLKSARADAERRLDALKEACRRLPQPDPVFVIINAHITDFLQALTANLRDKYTRPSSQIGGFMWMYEFLYSQDSREPGVRARKAVAKLSHTAAMFDAMGQWIHTVSPIYQLEALEACKGNISAFQGYLDQVDEHFPSVEDSLRAELKSTLDSFIAQNKAMATQLEALLKTADIPGETTDDSILKIDPEVYADHLLSEHGVMLQELLDWHEQEIEKTRASAFAIAQALDIPDPKPTTMGDVNALLLKYAGPCDTPEETLSRGRAYIERTRAAAKDYVWMPEETCQVVPVPEVIKYSYPWGGYGGGCHRRRPLVGEMFLNDFNFKAVTDGWIKMNTVHEAYPGHHVQFVRTTVDPIPETLKRGAKHTPITEGTPHRSEQLFEFVFAEDPFYPLFVAYRRHHTAVRIKADLMLRYFGAPIRDVVQLYMREMDFDRQTARGQVKAQENMLGYFTTYYYGYKKLSQWEREYNFDPKAYTELLFSAGRMSLENFKRFLDLTDEERHSLLHDFASLLQFNEDYTEKPIKMD